MTEAFTPSYTIEDFQFDPDQYYNHYSQNPLLDENNQPIDFNGSGTEGKDWALYILCPFGFIGGVAQALNPNGLSGGDISDLMGAWQSAMAEVDAACITAQSTAYAAATSAKGAIAAAEVSAHAQMYDADQQLAAVKDQGDTDKYIAETQAAVEREKLEVERESIEKVDAVNANANLISANALTISANAEQTEADAKLEKAQNPTATSSIF